MGRGGAIVTVGTALLIGWIWINERQPEPYMDELFHVPQARNFCAVWNTRRYPRYSPDITTPPMIYLIAAALSPLFGCSTALLRLYSATATLLSLPLVAALAQSVFKVERHYSWRIALIITTHPPLLFYSTLFYTDSFSLFAILFTFYLSAALDTSPAAALCGFFSSCIRQTNAVWHAFFAFLALLRQSHKPIPHLAAVVAAPHAIAGILYVALFALNKFKVALGDQARHSVMFHGMQLNIFAVYRLAFAFPLFLRHPLRPSRLHLFVAIVSCILVYQTSHFVHPFILADNRHLMFYVHRKLLRFSAVRYSLIPLFSVAFLLPLASLLDLLALAPILITLLPSPLIEPRYFIPPFVISMLLYLSRNCKRLSISTTVICCAFNLISFFVLVFIFAEMPFSRLPDPHMPNDVSPGRFML